VRAQVERGIESAYDYVGERLRLGLPLRLVSQLKLAPSINFELYQLSNASAEFVPGQPLPPGSTQPVLENCKASGLCFLMYLEQLVAWDARDSLVNWRKGWYAAVTLQEGVRVGGYGYRYLRFQPELRAYYPLGRHAVVAARARVGGLIPINETGKPPVVARFHAGGPLSMRGYYTDRLSPMVRQDGSWVSLGANGAADGSLELRFDIAGNWGAAIFVDTGGVSDNSASPTEYQTALDPTLLQWASGLGLRYRTPFGPVRLDVGVRLPTDYRAGVPFAQRFPAVPHTTPPGTVHREPIMAVQLALGEAF
jgi:translocation and assembly module TamA